MPHALEKREPRVPRLKPPAAPDCCALSIIGCIEEVSAVITPIKPSLNVNQNLSVSANPTAQVKSAANANADAAASADAAAVAPPTAATPAAEADASSIPDSNSDANSDSVANAVTNSTLAQTMFRAQELVTIAIQYRVKWHVCNYCRCVIVSGQVLEGGRVIYNFQAGDASGEVGFMTLSVLPTIQQFSRGTFTLNLACTDASTKTASFTDTSPQVIHV